MLRRALALFAVAARAAMEADAARADAADWQARMLAWLARTGLDAELENGERALLQAPPGSLGEAAVLDAGWRAEGVYALAWALGVHPPLPHDRLADPNDLAGPLGFLDTRALEALEAASLRPEHEIDSFLARQLAVHWRLREYALRPGPMDFAAVVATGGWARLDIDAAALIDRDLAIDGDPIDRAASDAISRCTSIASERHRAASWLAGADPLYSNVETIT
ncbi:DUF4272 domain-containing protein [Luteimonas sp. MC1782]|nr:DUF4272 domain-containing protein [Luteimonas sp. MC1895]MBJ6983261.1 DUF4272 domain-containing protein [Luteimonas sp. MC1750]QQO05475.1 DUF4272 domain-containing protein [Luteimonas sp. MC1750]